jgi:rhamnosyltransferase
MAKNRIRAQVVQGNGTREMAGSSAGAPTSKLICAVIVTFHPDSEILDRVEKIASEVAQVVIVDNASGDACKGRLKEVSDKVRVELILNDRNEGIAIALNQGMRWAIDRGYEWVLTLDQDTIVAPDMVESLSGIYCVTPFRDELAVIGSNFTNTANGKPFHRFVQATDSVGEEVKTVITSGSLICVRVFQIIGGFRDDFFIDCVDLEYCLRARSHGFHIVIACRPLMQHSIGHVSEHRVLWKKTGTTNHSSWRQYSISRNTTILVREYMFKEFIWVLGTLWSRFKSILLMLFFEQERFQKIKYVVLGCLDGVRGKPSRLAQLLKTESSS